MSKALSSDGLIAYHSSELSNGISEYYSESETIPGQWVGDLADAFGLAGTVDLQHFDRLAKGQHPTHNDPGTGEPIQLIRYATPAPYLNEHGKEVTPMAHVGGWGPTLSASKSVSLAALVGGDDRVIAAHRAAVDVTWREFQHFVQAKPSAARRREMGGIIPETTGQFVGATFEHDSARPVLGYAAPQLHTHLVIFNMTEAADGKIRSIQPLELFKSQAYATAVYRTELARQLRSYGYDIVVGEFNQPEIRGFTKDYLEASSPRRSVIKDYLEQEERSGAGAAQIAALVTREAKLPDRHEDMRLRHAEMAQAFGNQPALAVAASKAHGPRVTPIAAVNDLAAKAITYAKERNIEKQAVFEDRQILTDGLRRSMGHVPVDRIKSEFDGRTGTEFLERRSALGAVARSYTTPEMIVLEQQTIDAMLQGRAAFPPLATLATQRESATAGMHLNAGQREAIATVLSSRDRITALDGIAGSGKTTALCEIRAAAERDGYTVQGLAPTSSAAKELQKAGMLTQTVQRHLLTHKPTAGPMLHVLDESSLASTVQMHQFLTTLGPEDQVLLVGDTRQHQSVEAGRIYEQLIDHGLSTARLTTIVRQKDAAYKAMVEQLATGDVRGAIADLDSRGFVIEIPRRSARVRAVADDFCASPEGTLVVAPANEARRALNEAIHAELVAQRHLTGRPKDIGVLVERQEITGADRKWVSTYEVDNVLRFSAASASLGVKAGDYATVTGVDPDAHRITVAHEDGRTLTYDPSRLYGVSLYREERRLVAVGERMQFKQPFRDHRIANGELGTVVAVSGQTIRIKTARGKTVGFRLQDYRHLDYGYACTSYSSQGLTNTRVILDIDTDLPGAVSNRVAYTALSRGEDAAIIYTNNADDLPRVLSRDNSHRSAIEETPVRRQVSLAR